MQQIGQKAWKDAEGNLIADPDHQGFNLTKQYIFEIEHDIVEEDLFIWTPPKPIGTQVHVFRIWPENKRDYLGTGRVVAESDHFYKVRCTLGFSIETGKGNFLITDNDKTAEQIAKSLNIIHKSELWQSKQKLQKSNSSSLKSKPLKSKSKELAR